MPLVTEHYHPICFYKCAHSLVYKCSIAVHLLSNQTPSIVAQLPVLAILNSHNFYNSCPHT